MKAIIYTTYGPPEVAQLTEIEKPVPKDNEVLIKVHASTVNRTDCGFRSANYFIVRFFSGLFRPRNKVLGCEFAGKIEAVGKNVTAFKPGDRVFGFNDARFGGHAEFMTIAENEALATIPENTTYETAAAATEGSHYALVYIKAAKISSGQQVLVNGATGAIGSAGVQLLKHFGAIVTAVCHTHHTELVKSLGADEVIDYTEQDFTALERLQNRFDVVFDAVGKSSFGKCKPLLKRGGIYVSTELGPGYENPFLGLVTPLFGGKKVLFPLPTSTREDVLFLRELLATGKFKPVIDRTYSLDQIVEAYRYVDTGQKVGNVLLQVSSGNPISSKKQFT